MAVYRQTYVVATTLALLALAAVVVLTFQAFETTLSAIDARPNWPIVATLLTLILIGAAQLRRESSRRGGSEAALRAAFAQAEERAHAREVERDQLRARLAESEAREAHARDVAADANLLRDEFLSTVSHELRTPLNVIVGWTRLARLGTAIDLNHALEVIERNALAQTRLIDELLDMSHIVRGHYALKIASADLGTAARAAIATVSAAAAAKHIAVALEGEERGTLVAADYDRLQQAIWQVLSNAVKFTPEGGRVDLALTTSKDHATLTVRDSGSGIDPTFLPHIFEPFRQSRAARTRAGMGLGLPIARRIIELHGGTISARSDGPNQGTLITICLPLITPLQSSDPAGC